MSADSSASPTDLDLIERPQEMGLPPEAEQVLEALTERGAPVFSQEITRAIFKAQATGNLRPVRDVVEMWYRTLLFKNQPGYQEIVRWSHSGDEPDRFPAEDLVEQYRRP